MNEPQSNPFDIVGASAVGLSTIWIDRGGKGWSDMLAGEPTFVVKELAEVVQKVTRILQEQTSSIAAEGDVTIRD